METINELTKRLDAEFKQYAYYNVSDEEWQILKTSVLAQQSTNSIKAEIAALVNDEYLYDRNHNPYVSLETIREKLRQLSAV